MNRSRSNTRSPSTKRSTSTNRTSSQKLLNPSMSLGLTTKAVSPQSSLTSTLRHSGPINSNNTSSKVPLTKNSVSAKVKSNQPMVNGGVFVPSPKLQSPLPVPKANDSIPISKKSPLVSQAMKQPIVDSPIPIPFSHQSLSGPPLPSEIVFGEITCKYSHYSKKFPVENGVLDWKLVDEEYCLSYVFSDKALIALIDQSTNQKILRNTVSNTFNGLVPGGVYEAEIEENVEVEAGKTFTAYIPQTVDKMDSIRKSGNGNLDGTDGASCSCIEGNPCAVPYNCKDWNNRLEVAKKHGWKGFS